MVFVLFGGKFGLDGAVSESKGLTRRSRRITEAHGEASDGASPVWFAGAGRGGVLGGGLEKRRCLEAGATSFDQVGRAMTPERSRRVFRGYHVDAARFLPPCTSVVLRVLRGKTLLACRLSFPPRRGVQ